jgi:hypothetical protein
MYFYKIMKWNIFDEYVPLYEIIIIIMGHTVA